MPQGPTKIWASTSYGLITTFITPSLRSPKEFVGLGDLDREKMCGLSAALDLVFRAATNSISRRMRSFATRTQCGDDLMVTQSRGEGLNRNGEFS